MTASNSTLRLVVCALALWYLTSGSCHHTKPLPPGVPDLRAAFATNDSVLEAKQDALALGELCRSISDAIEYDGQLDEPHLRNGVQFDRLRRWAREYRFNGQSLGVKYPALPGAIREFLNKELGQSGGPVDAEQRKKWVGAFRKLADACEYAAR